MTTYKDLAGKRIVITGGASGIGLATALRFVEEGSRVAVLDIDRKALDAAVRKHRGIEGAIQADVSDSAQVARAFRKTDKLFGGVDVLIANAGISIRKAFMDIPDEQWARVIHTNLDGIFYCAREAARRMKARGSGVVLMTASTNGTEGHPFYADYNASKAGVILLAKTMALELAPVIRVNAICPGYVLTPMQKAEYTPEMLEAVNLKIPMKRHADPSEVAALFAFLASAEAAYITGAEICIDGGETAGLS
jgi:meso-butanediol dehydrogenase/(S,S)-butanediol dehydrogenase/diacetyl reductase